MIGKWGNKKSKVIADAGEKLKAIASRPNFMVQAVSIALIVFLALPFFKFLFNLFMQGGGFSLAAFQDAFLTRTSYFLIQETFLIALGAAVLAFLIGVPLGFFFSATRFPLRRVFLSVLIAPLFIPAYLWALGWDMIIGRRGYLEELLWEGAGDFTGAFLLSTPGAIFVLGLYFAGLAVLSVVLFLKLKINDFALDSRESWQGNFLRFLNHYRQSFIAWACFYLAVLLLFKEFGSLSLLGCDTLNVEIFSFFSTFYNVDSVTAPGLIVLIFAAVFWAVWEWGFKQKVLSLSDASFKGKTAILEPGLWKTPIFWVLLFVITAFYFFPVWIFFIRSEGIGFYWEALKTSGSSLLHTVIFMVLSSLILSGAVYLIDRFLRVSKSVYAGLVEKLAAFVFFVPGVLTGVIINRFWYASWGALVYTTVAIMILGTLTQFLYPVLFGKNFFEQSSGPSELTGRHPSGANKYLNKIFSILNDKRMLGVLMVSVLISLRELGSTVFLSPAGREPLLVRIFALKPVETEPVISALAVIYLILLSIPVAVLAVRFKK